MLKPTDHNSFSGICSLILNRPVSVIMRVVLPVLFLVVTLFIAPVFAELKPMDDSNLKSTTAQQGFTQFVMDNNTARMFLDIHIETYTEIGALSGGYYAKGGTTGWDQQWNTVSIGSATTPLIIDGLVLMTDFDGDDIKHLKRVVIGSNRLQGDLTANFNSYSGCYNNALVDPSATGITTLDRTPIGALDTPTTFHFNSNGDQTKDMGLFFILNMNDNTTIPGAQQGLQVVAGFDEKTLKAGTTSWWDAP